MPDGPSLKRAHPWMCSGTTYRACSSWAATAASALVSVSGARRTVRCVRRPGEQQRNVHRPNPRPDLGGQVERGVIAADVDGGQPVSAERETGDLAGQRFTSGRAVPGWNRGDLRVAAVWPGDRYLLPSGKGTGGAAEPPRRALGREGDWCGLDDLAASGIEIVRVLIMRQEDDVDGHYLSGVRAGPSVLVSGRPGALS